MKTWDLNGRGERIRTSDPWSRNGSGCSNVLILLVQCCVVVHRFTCYLGGLDPRLDPTFDIVPHPFRSMVREGNRTCHSSPREAGRACPSARPSATSSLVGAASLALKSGTPHQVESCWLDAD